MFDRDRLRKDLTELLDDGGIDTDAASVIDAVEKVIDAAEAHPVPMDETLNEMEGGAGECECDNTHEQNDTVCQWCWARGRRKWSDPEVAETTHGDPN